MRGGPFQKNLSNSLKKTPSHFHFLFAGVDLYGFFLSFWEGRKKLFGSTGGATNLTSPEAMKNFRSISAIQELELLPRFFGSSKVLNFNGIFLVKQMEKRRVPVFFLRFFLGDCCGRSKHIMRQTFQKANPNILKRVSKIEMMELFHSQIWNNIPQSYHAGGLLIPTL